MSSLVGMAPSPSSGVHGVSSAYHPQSLDGALLPEIAHQVLKVRSVGSPHLLPAASDTVKCGG